LAPDQKLRRTPLTVILTGAAYSCLEAMAACVVERQDALLAFEQPCGNIARAKNFNNNAYWPVHCSSARKAETFTSGVIFLVPGDLANLV